MLEGWVNRPESGLFSHDNAICAEGNQCPRAHALARRYDLEIVAEHADKIDEILRRRRIPARRVEDERNPGYRAQRVQVIDEQIDDVLTYLGFQASSVARHVEDDFRFPLILDSAEHLSSIGSGHFCTALAGQ